MSVNYNSKKKPELEALLKERGLPHSGNKPDLVQRLQDDDASKAAAGGGDAAPAPPADDIDWDEGDTNAPNPNLAAAEQTEDPAHKAILAAGGIGRVNNPVDVPNQIVDEANDPGRTEDSKVIPPAETEASAPAVQESAEETEAKKKAYEEHFSANLAASEAEQEAAKRAARLLRFPQAQTAPAEADALTEEQKAEQAKKEERAKKFGASAEPVAGESDKIAKALDSALPERRERKRGRDRGDVGRGGVNKRVDSRRRDNGPKGPRNAPARSGLSDADRQAREKRAQRFGAKPA